MWTFHYLCCVCGSLVVLTLYLLLLRFYLVMSIYCPFIHTYISVLKVFFKFKCDVYVQDYVRIKRHRDMGTYSNWKRF